MRRRKAAGLSQAALAETIGVTQGAISSWETGRISAPRDQVEALERALAGEESVAGSSPSSALLAVTRRVERAG
ncbi:MAG: helix-turn-helix domain-containing protein [Actinomycetota bacterium]|nr:helix-turn-helix domain-containing protein [Actinomycetota bacterium]